MTGYLTQAQPHHHPFAFHPDLFSVGIPLFLVFGVPAIAWVLRQVRKTNGRFTADIWMPLLAGFAWFWAIQLPNIPVTDQSESTLMHFIGGAIVAPLLYFYFARAGQFSLPSMFVWRAALFFGFTFILFGVGNEVFEFALVKLLHLKIELADTWFDLLADLAGSCVAFTTIELARNYKANR